VAVTMEEVRAELERDEPNYARAAGLGPEALPHLEELAQGDDTMLATKAVYLAGLIQDDRSAKLLEEAAKADDPRVRVAAAAAARNVKADSASGVLAPLVADDDPGVRKVALKSVPPDATEELRRAVERVAEEDEADETTRRLSREALRRIGE
jgi:HEAT repeat protein